MPQIDLVGPDSHSSPFNTGDVSKEKGWGPKRIIDALNTMLTELYAGIAGAAAFTVTAATVTADRPVVLPTYTAAALPDPADAAWNGTDPEATVISLLKAIAINTATP